MIAGSNAVTISEVELPIGGTGSRTVHLYYRTGTACGNASSATGWTLIGTPTVNVVNASPGLTSVPFPVAVTIPAGQTYGFYFAILNAVSNGIKYAGSTTVCGSTVLGGSNSDLTVMGGHGLQTITDVFVSTYVWSERYFCGKIHYTTGGGGGSVTYNVYRDSNPTPVASNLTVTNYTDSGFDQYAGHTWDIKVNCDGGVQSAAATQTLEACDTPNDCEDRPVGTGTVTSYIIPSNLYWRHTYSQQIFDAADIGAPGLITEIALQYFYATPLTRPSETIYLGNTTTSTFANATDWVPFSQLQQVFTGTIVSNTMVNH
jgi:hypothetical protein